MRSDSNRRQRSSVELVFSEAYRLFDGVVMIAGVRFFHRDVLQFVVVQQMPCEVAARAGIAVVRPGVAREDTLYPQAGPEDEQENEDCDDQVAHRPSLAVYSCLYYDREHLQKD